jgi:AraC-like DNA-binding protein
MGNRIEKTEISKANLEIVHKAPESAFTSIAHPWPWPQCVWHHHKEYEIHLILNASGQAWVGDYIGPFVHGHIVLVGPDLPHNWTSHSIAPPDQPAQEDHVIQFSHDSFGQGFFEIPDLAEIKELLKRGAQGVEFFGCSTNTLERIMRLRHLSGAERFLCLLEILTSLARVEDYRVLCSPSYSPVLGDGNVMRINKILSYMRLNMATDLTIEAACAYLHMQPRSFSRFFNQITGRRFSDYLCEMRIGESCNLLLNTDRPITDICFAVGFSNISWFNRCFLEIKGVTPREFRRAALARYGPFDQRGHSSAKVSKHDAMRAV